MNSVHLFEIQSLNAHRTIAEFNASTTTVWSRFSVAFKEQSATDHFWTALSCKSNFELCLTVPPVTGYLIALLLSVRLFYLTESLNFRLITAPRAVRNGLPGLCELRSGRPNSKKASLSKINYQTKLIESVHFRLL